MTCNAVNFIKLLQKQNEEALEYIIDEYSALVNAISYKILHNVSSDAVDECVNDVFLTVWQNANKFKKNKYGIQEMDCDGYKIQSN